MCYNAYDDLLINPVRFNELQVYARFIGSSGRTVYHLLVNVKLII